MLDLEHLKKTLRYDATTGKLFSIRTGREVFTHIDAKGYARGTVQGKGCCASRVIWYLVTGEWPSPALDIDHIDRDRSNNRWVNLRLVSHAENIVNSGLRKDNSSGHKGVLRIASGWQARITRNGKRKTLGTFLTKDAAIQAYVEEANRASR